MRFPEVSCELESLVLTGRHLSSWWAVGRSLLSALSSRSSSAAMLKHTFSSSLMASRKLERRFRVLKPERRNVRGKNIENISLNFRQTKKYNEKIILKKDFLKFSWDFDILKFLRKYLEFGDICTWKALLLEAGHCGVLRNLWERRVDRQRTVARLRAPRVLRTRII